MNELERDMMDSFSNKPVNLKAILKEYSATNKVKILACRATNKTGKDEMEKQINDFIADREVLDIQTNVCKNFLDGSVTGEYEELWYVTILYRSVDGSDNL